MSKLDELIQQYCPDGVTTVPLGEVAHYAKTRTDASEMNENNYVGVENLLQEKQGKTIASSVPASGSDISADGIQWPLHHFVRTGLSFFLLPSCPQPWAFRRIRL